MKAFAELLDSLSFQHGRNGKLALLQRYIRETPDPDRGWALAALTGDLSLRHAKPAMVRGLAMERVDETLFALSYDYVGDLAETVALIWPERPGANRIPSLSELIETVEATSKSELPALLTGWFDAMTATQRWATIKLITGALRIGVSARLEKTALARHAGIETDAVEEVWHAVEAPYGELLAWLDGTGERPDPSHSASFRPVMLAHPLDESELPSLDPAAYRAEWKWDGIRVQIVGEASRLRIYSRSGDEIGHTFPDLLDGLDLDATLDGELLVLRDSAVAPFADVQKRLNRKTVSAKLMASHPAHVRLYDILAEAGEDLRALPFDQRRSRLEQWVARTRPERMDLSAMVPFSCWDDLAQLRATETENGVEGLMLKLAGSAYAPGRPKGLWFKWKRDPALIDAVLMYAQRGHGKRNSIYSDYTFGVWRDSELVPVGKAYFGFTDEELQQIDKWVRDHTTERFGPVRAVEQKLVLEVAFEGLQRSTRHKSGVAMRFPRISRIRWDKHAAEADVLTTLEAMLPN
ncbi:MAG: cisplatin damage response ATP-dependent DNA ligase [Rhodospirillaceae bacterium]|nr:cisplatin damage response ATP-dependent DNA ligase [Rhodospirillaceae bacterium]